jgi:HEAT repeat protein
MGKKLGILLAVSFVGLAGGVFWMLSRPVEPVYQGRPLSAWLNELYPQLNEDTNQAASAAFRQMGTNAIPALLKIIQSGDPPFEDLFSELNRMQSRVHFPVRERWQQRWAASRALYAMGTNARPAFPTLTNLLLHDSAATYGALPLAGMGSEGLPPLLAALTNQSPFIRAAAARGLEEERSDLNIVVPALIARLSDRDTNVHQMAVTALGYLHAEPELAVPALLKDFSGKDPQLRFLIVLHLGQFGTNAAPAVPMLLESLSGNDPRVRRTAAWALKKIDPAAAAKAGVK